MRFKWKRKPAPSNKNYGPRKNVNPNSFFSQGKDSFISEREKIFKEIKSFSKQGADAYVKMNEKRFKHVLLSREYVDARYIALQIYLLQDTIGTFKYEEINNSVNTLIIFIEKTLLKGRSISFDDIFYLSGALRESNLITKGKVPRVAIFRARPRGIVFALKDLEINLSGTREFALHELVIRHFNRVFLNLLATKGQVLIGNIVVIQLGIDYSVVVSERFLVGTPDDSETSGGLLPAPPLAPTRKKVHPAAPATPRLSYIRYKTEQVFLNQKSKRFTSKSNRISHKISNALDALNKQGPPVSPPKQPLSFWRRKKIDTTILKNEITDANALIGKFKFKKQAPARKKQARSGPGRNK